MQNLRDEDQEGSLEWLVSTYPELNLNQATKKSKKCNSQIWRATREKGLSDVCVKCRFRSAYAVRTG